jgi:hypothetical protein
MERPLHPIAAGAAAPPLNNDHKDTNAEKHEHEGAEQDKERRCFRGHVLCF